MKKLKEKYPYMTFEELREKYPDRWVLLVNPKRIKNSFDPIGGNFVYKHKNRLKIIDKLLDFKLNGTTEIIFAGEFKFPENMVICLNL